MDISIYPAVGTPDPKSKKAAIKSWKDGDDWVIGGPNGQRTSIRDSEHLMKIGFSGYRIDTVNIRYKKGMFMIPVKLEA